MRHLARFLPALAGLLIVGVITFGEVGESLCRVAPPSFPLAQSCAALKPLRFYAAVFAIGLIILSLLLLWRWQQSRSRVISYESDAGRWIVLGWILTVGGVISLLAGLLLIGSGGWPFSQQSRHITIRTGQLPLFISTVQRRYFANYFGADGAESLCASFGAVTIRNRSRSRSLVLDLGLSITPRDGGNTASRGIVPTREDIAAIARRGLAPQAIFGNPVELGPRESLRRELVFVVRPAGESLSDSEYLLALDVTERLSGQRVSFALPAEYRG